MLLVFLLRAPLDGATLPAPVRAERPVPVVVVVFDEFPTASLLGSGERIDTRRMPTFATLAETSVVLVGHHGGRRDLPRRAGDPWGPPPVGG